MPDAPALPLRRRGFLLGLLAAPIVVRTPGLLMPVKPGREVLLVEEWPLAPDDAGTWRFSDAFENALIDWLLQSKPVDMAAWRGRLIVQMDTLGISAGEVRLDN